MKQKKERKNYGFFLSGETENHDREKNETKKHPMANKRGMPHHLHSIFLKKRLFMRNLVNSMIDFLFRSRHDASHPDEKQA